MATGGGAAARWPLHRRLAGGPAGAGPLHVFRAKRGPIHHRGFAATRDPQALRPDEAAAARAGVSARNRRIVPARLARLGGSPDRGRRQLPWRRPAATFVECDDESPLFHLRERRAHVRTAGSSSVPHSPLLIAAHRSEDGAVQARRPKSAGTSNRCRIRTLNAASSPFQAGKIYSPRTMRQRSRCNVGLPPYLLRGTVSLEPENQLGMSRFK